MLHDREDPYRCPGVAVTMRHAILIAIALLVAACGGSADSVEEIVEKRLPHVNAPLDTVNVIETTQDTSVVEITSGAEMAEPAWKTLDLRGLPDPKELHFTRYENPDYNYSIAYPDSLLKTVQPVGENRGMEFASPRQDVNMLVYAIEASTREDLDAQYRAALNSPETSVLYRARDENWYIVSGKKGDDIFYEKSISDGGMLKTFRIEYPSARKDYYDAVTAIISASFAST